MLLDAGMALLMGNYRTADSNIFLRVPIVEKITVISLDRTDVRPNDRGRNLNLC
jgi:hypothetical protein